MLRTRKRRRGWEGVSHLSRNWVLGMKNISLSEGKREEKTKRGAQRNRGRKNDV